MPTLYDELGVTPSASPEAIRQAYRQLARQHHPDATDPHDAAARAAATVRFQRLNDAHDVLSDPARRHSYDLILRALQLRASARARAAAPDDPYVIVRAAARAQGRPTRARRESWRERYGGIVIVSALVALLGLSLWLLSRSVIEPARVMDLSYRGLDTWPEALGRGVHIVERLNLRDNALSSLPPELGAYSRLVLLDASYNRIAQLPPELGAMPLLSGLHLEGNELTELPPELGELPRLRVLNLAHNRLTRVPDGVLRAPQLDLLDLRGNPLAPGELARLRRLRPGLDIRF